MKFQLACIFIFLVTLSGCKKVSEIERQFHELEAFHTIDLNSSFEVILTEDSTYFMEIVSTEKNIDKTKFNVEDSVLSIVNERKLKWTNPEDEPIKIYINSKKLKRVNANETCNITNTNPITTDEFGITFGSKTNTATLDLNCRVFYYWNSFPCGGKLILRGKTDELKLWNTALMAIDAKNITTKFALVENDSKGTIEVNVTEKLDYKITGTGDIHLYGKPGEITNMNSNSSGNLVEL